jgi:hypothetical protein
LPKTPIFGGDVERSQAFLEQARFWDKHNGETDNR